MKSVVKENSLTRSSMLLFAVCTIELTACLLPLEDQNLQGTPETSTAPNPGPLTAYPTPFLCQAGVIEQVFQFGRMFWVGATLDERCRETHEFAPDRKSTRLNSSHQLISYAVF